MVSLAGGEGVVVHELSDGTGDPEAALLLLHATGLHGRVWTPLVGHLPDSLRARCLAMDARGHGASAPLPEGGLSWDELSADILRVVDELHLDRPLAVGHSSGASLLLLAEEQRPGTFAGLYCIEPIGTADDEPPAPDPSHPLAHGALRRRRLFASRQAAFDTYRTKPPFSSVAPEALWAYVDHGFIDVPEDEGGGVRLQCQPEAEAAMYARGLSHHAYRDLGRVRCPVVLARGDQSRAVSTEGLAAWAARLDNARVELLPGLGHFAPLEDPPAVARAVASTFGATA